MTTFPTMMNPPYYSMPTTPAAASIGELNRYTSLMELRTELRALEAETNLTVVLVLDERFCGHLASLVARPMQRPAMRLVLAVGSGRLPGLETIGDLAAGGAAMGWHEIVLETDAWEAVRGAKGTLRDGERLIVFAPSWHATDAVERELRRVA